MGSLEVVNYAHLALEDRDAVVILLTEFFHHHAKNLSGSARLQTGWVEVLDQFDSFDRTGHALLIAKLEGAVVGCVGLRPFENSSYENSCEMVFLYVKPIFRGFGLGHQLLSSFIDLARECNYSHVLFDPLEEHEAIRQLYDDFGFQEIPPLGHHASQPQTLMALSLSLSSSS
jgi:GNAT superfamily N-acetyltransferase